MDRTKSYLGRVIAVGNQKGGVGKTTSCTHIAAALGERGRRVLIWDLDMNAGASKSFGIHTPVYAGTPEVMLGTEKAANVIVDETDNEITLPQNVHLLPCRRQLEDVDKDIFSRNKFAPYMVLREPVAELRPHYDYVLLDTAPNATLATLSAYQATRYFILTALPDHFSMIGLEEALSDIHLARNNGNPDLQLLGVLLTGIDRRTNIAATISEYIAKAFTPPDGKGSAKFDTEISRTVSIVTAQKAGRTLLQTNPTHQVSDQFRRLAAEIEERIDVMESRGRSADASTLTPAAPAPVVNTAAAN